MSDIALFLVGFVVFTIAFVASLCYAYLLLTQKFDFNRLHPDEAQPFDIRG